MTPKTPAAEPIALAHNLEFAAGKEPPKEFRLFPAGAVETTKGIFLFDAQAQASVMAKATDWGNDYPVDYDHAMGSIFATDPAQSGKAAGWFKPVVKNGELWATEVSWTPAAAKMLTDREYRYCSPRFHIEDDGGRISELVNVALTNLPATKRMDPLMASRAGEPGNPKESKMKTLLVALALAADATEAEALSAVQTLKTFADQVLSLVGAKTMAEVHGVLAAWKGNEAKVATLSAEVAAFKAREADAEVELLIADGKKVGKITPSSEPEVRKLAKDHGAAALKMFLSAALAAPKEIKEPAEAAGAGLSPTELAIAQKRGLDLKKLAETKAKAIDEGTYPGAA